MIKQGKYQAFVGSVLRGCRSFFSVPFSLSFLLCFALSLSLGLSVTVHAHEGHQDEDIILKDLGNLGEVDFKVSCDKPAQEAFNTGVALLHHMMYAQAEELFQKWKQKSPDCAMMYWGYSMSLFHPLWPDKISKMALAKGQRAISKAATLKVSEREQAYIQAAAEFYKDWKAVAEPQRIKAWADAHKGIYKQYPKDVDAIAFYGLAQLVVASKTDKTFSANKKAGELLAGILESNPLHPGAIHYSIHAYDNPVLAEVGAEPARAYDKIAPDVPHALHMPTHIFVRLGEWKDAISWNARSAKAALKYPSHGATSMHYVHALDYLIYGQLQLGNGAEAVKVFEQSHAHHPMQNTFPVAYALSTMPARISLEQQQWQKASQLKTREPSYISWDNFPQLEAISYFARGLGAARSGNLDAARNALATLNQLHTKATTISPNYWAPLVNAQRKSVKAWLLFVEGKKQKALALQREAADIEDSLDKDPVTPGAVLPARDLLGDMLRLDGKLEAAQQAYKASLKIGPNRRYSLEGIKKAKQI
ncbi:MAG: hypothetical protein OIF51_07790 [Cellvibrionaceae bacterium]|nr:hypothetical protein [Cellvibrionaceae bacterium]